MVNGRDFYVTATANYIPSFFGSARASSPLRGSRPSAEPPACEDLLESTPGPLRFDLTHLSCIDAPVQSDWRAERRAEPMEMPKELRSPRYARARACARCAFACAHVRVLVVRAYLRVRACLRSCGVKGYTLRGTWGGHCA